MFKGEVLPTHFYVLFIIFLHLFTAYGAQLTFQFENKILKISE